MDKLNDEKKTTAVAMLCEGNSIRSVERMTGIHRDTIMRLGVRMGGALSAHHGRKDAQFALSINSGG